MAHLPGLIISPIICLIAGATLPYAFAPYHHAFLAVLSLAALFHSLQHTASAWHAAILGYLFGGAMFLSGINWLHISINMFGGVPLPLAHLITLLLSLILALYIALFAYLYRRFFHHTNSLSQLLILPTLWTLIEILRGSGSLAFPWLNIAYSQIDTIISPIAPILGGYSLSWLTAAIAAMLAIAFALSWRRRLLLATIVILIGLGLQQLHHLQWSEPTGELSVAIIQGGIPQIIKWDHSQRQKTMQTYLTLSAKHPDSDLIIWPETAIPMPYHQAQGWLRHIDGIAEDQQQDYLIGIPYRDQSSKKSYNSIIVTGKGQGIYHKQHLVPFGEYTPLAQWLSPLLRALNITLSNFSSGTRESPPLLHAAGIAIGVSICYEVVFASQIIRALPSAQLLVNVSNDAWFGDSIAADQHLQIARLRALESNRYMLRATNTGISAIIDQAGRITHRAPQFSAQTLAATVKTYQGLTPYARFGDTPLLLALLLICLCTALPLSKTYRRKTIASTPASST